MPREHRDASSPANALLSFVVLLMVPTLSRLQKLQERLESQLLPRWVGSAGGGSMFSYDEWPLHAMLTGFCQHRARHLNTN